MIAIARPLADDRQGNFEDVARYSAPLVEEPFPGLAARHAHRSGAAASPWRAPLFYLSFIAAALLLASIGVVLLWRVLHRRPRF